MIGPYSNFTNNARAGILRTGVGVFVTMPTLAAKVTFTLNGREVSPDAARAILGGKVKARR